MRSNLSVLGVFLLLSTAQAGSYTVQKSDTLYSLSKRFGLSVEELMKLNHLDEPKLSLGQVLQVPDVQVAPGTAEAPVSAKPKEQPKEHIVAKQETLFGIAKKYGVSMDDLRRWNGLEGNDLAIGQVLKLSGAAGTASAPTKTEVKADLKDRPGTTEAKTSKTEPVKTGTAKTESKPVQPQASKPTPVKPEAKVEPKTPENKAEVKASVSKPETVKPETVKPETARPQTVKTETVKTPVKDSKTEATKIAEPLKTGVSKTDPIQPEAVKTSAEPQTPVKVAKVKPVLNDPTIYVVERGDNLYNLARKFGVTVDDLMTWNGLESNALAVGQTLQLIAKIQPAPEATPKQAEVKPEIKAEPVPVKVVSTVKPTAEQEKVTVKAVQVVDNATVITPVLDPEHHTVQKGDTLSALARKYATTVGALQEANGLIDTDLKVGQVLILPSTLKNIPQPSNLVDIVSPTSNPWRDYAMSLLNLPYIYGGNNPDQGLDCSSFTLLVMQQAGVQLPRTSMQQSQIGQPVDRQTMEEGDLIFFDTLGHGVSHVGIYLGDNQFIHANSYLERVSIDDITNSYYAKRVVGVRRVLAPLATAQR